MTVLPIGSFYNAQNVKVGSAIGFFAPVGSTDPLETSLNVFDPANYPDPWVPFGGTEAGWTVNYNPQTQDINIDEQPTPVDQQVQTASLQFVANLAEDTIDNLAMAFNADSTVRAPGAGVAGRTRLTLSGNLKRLKVALEIATPAGKPRRFVVDEATCAANVGYQLGRTTRRLIPVTFTSVTALENIKIDELTAAATS